MFSKKTIKDVDVRGKRVLVRVDFNVPLHEGSVVDDTRVRAALPTLRYLVDHGARVIIMSHLGRPKGEPDPRYSLRPVRRVLQRLLGRNVVFVDDIVGARPTRPWTGWSTARFSCSRTCASTRGEGERYRVRG
jgi:phosphoglycerate kinase